MYQIHLLFSSISTTGVGQVARIEQLETPDMMQERVKGLKKATKFDKVVKREVCQVTNRGTQVFSQQVSVTNNYEPTYMLAVCEKVCSWFPLIRH